MQKEEVNQIVVVYKIGTQSDRKSQKRGSSRRNLPTMPTFGSTFLGSRAGQVENWVEMVRQDGSNVATICFPHTQLAKWRQGNQAHTMRWPDSIVVQWARQKSAFLLYSMSDMI